MTHQGLKPLWKRLCGPPYRLLLRFLDRLWRFSPPRLWTLAVWCAAVLRAIWRRRREPRLTVAVDVNSFWEPLTGIGWSLYRLLEHLAERDDVRLRLYGPDHVVSPDLAPPQVVLPTGAAIEHIRYQPPPETLAELTPVVKLMRLLRPLLVAADGNRVVFAPNFFPPRSMSWARGALVATVHDLGYRFFADTLADETLAELEAKMSRVFRHAERIITPTEAVRAEIVAEGLAPEERIRAVHHGPGQLTEISSTTQTTNSAVQDLPDLPDLPTGVPQHYALWVGTLEPRKNLVVLLDAWRLLLGRGVEPPTLLLCGKLGWKATELAHRVEAASTEGWLRHLGYVSNEELAVLYRRAHLFCFPSRYEGFGLPLLEAMALGVPTLASDLPVLREVGGRGALYADAERPDEWADTITELLTHPETRQELAAKAIERAGEFSWHRTADETLEVLSAAVRTERKV